MPAILGFLNLFADLRTSCAARHSAIAAEAAPCFEPKPGVARFAIQALTQTTTKFDRPARQLTLLTCNQFPFLWGVIREMETKMQRQEKCDPLHVHLESVGLERIAMSFDEIERVIGSNLPASARKHRAWWGNDPSRIAAACAWLEAGLQNRKRQHRAQDSHFPKRCNRRAAASFRIRKRCDRDASCHRLHERNCDHIIGYRPHQAQLARVGSRHNRTGQPSQVSFCLVPVLSRGLKTAMRSAQLQRNGSMRISAMGNYMCISPCCLRTWNARFALSAEIGAPRIEMA